VVRQGSPNDAGSQRAVTGGRWRKANGVQGNKSKDDKPSRTYGRRDLATSHRTLARGHPGVFLFCADTRIPIGQAHFAKLCSPSHRMRLMPAIAANLLLFTAAIGFGSVLHCLIPQSFSRVDRFALKLLDGLAVLGTLLFCVCQLWSSRIAIILVFLPGLLLGLKAVARSAKGVALDLAKFRSPILPVVTAGVVLLVTVIGGRAEPIGDMNDDSIAYHFLGPKAWAATR
jgi:hypothetical protein